MCLADHLHAQPPEPLAGTVRAKKFFTVMAARQVKGLEEPCVEYVLVSSTDMDMPIPTWLLNYVVDKVLPSSECVDNGAEFPSAQLRLIPCHPISSHPTLTHPTTPHHTPSHTPSHTIPYHTIPYHTIPSRPVLNTHTAAGSSKMGEACAKYKKYLEEQQKEKDNAENGDDDADGFEDAAED